MPKCFNNYSLLFCSFASHPTRCGRSFISPSILTSFHKIFRKQRSSQQEHWHWHRMECTRWLTQYSLLTTSHDWKSPMTRRIRVLLIIGTNWTSELTMSSYCVESMVTRELTCSKTSATLLSLQCICSIKNNQTSTERCQGITETESSVASNGWSVTPQQPASPHASDDEENGHNQDSAAVAAASFMGLASNDSMIFDIVIGMRHWGWMRMANQT